MPQWVNGYLIFSSGYNIDAFADRVMTKNVNSIVAPLNGKATTGIYDTKQTFKNIRN